MNYYTFSKDIPNLCSSDAFPLHVRIYLKRRIKTSVWFGVVTRGESLTCYYIYVFVKTCVTVVPVNWWVCAAVSLTPRLSLCICIFTTDIRMSIKQEEGNCLGDDPCMHLWAIYNSRSVIPRPAPRTQHLTACLFHVWRCLFARIKIIVSCPLIWIGGYSLDNKDKLSIHWDNGINYYKTIIQW